MNVKSAYETYRRLLFSIAYRLLGSRTEAEDAVQDVFVSLHAADLERISDMKAFLSRAVANRCLNILKSARKKREVYPGPWLPEPLYGSADNEPELLLERSEHIRYACLVMLEQLSPVERAVFVLRGAFGFDYAEIAAVTEKSADNCRQIWSRAQRKMNSAGYDETPVDDKQLTIVRQFAHALQQGNIADAIGLLTDQVVIVTDGGGKVHAAMRPIPGIERVGAFLAGIARKGVFAGNVSAVSVNGEPGLLIRRAGLQAAVWSFELEPETGRIARIYSIYNPDKLIGQ